MMYDWLVNMLCNGLAVNQNNICYLFNILSVLYTFWCSNLSVKIDLKHFFSLTLSPGRPSDPAAPVGPVSPYKHNNSRQLVVVFKLKPIQASYFIFLRGPYFEAKGNCSQRH